MTSNPQATVHIAGDLRINQVNQDNSLDKVMALDASGTVKWIDKTSMV